MNRVTTAMRRWMLVTLTVSCMLAASVAAEAQDTQETPESPEQDETAEADTADQDTADQGFGESITVTAQKRDERLEEIPMSVTVLTSEALEREKVQDFVDLVAEIGRAHV